MAIDSKTWAKAKIMFEHGKSLSEISKETGINRSTISKKSTSEKWEKFNTKSTLVEAEVQNIIMQDEINSKKSTLNQQELNFHNDEVRSKVRHAGLINNNAEKLAHKLKIMTDQIDDPSDLRTLVEANDKLAITLKVAERHAPRAVTAVQVNGEDKAEHITFSKIEPKD